MNTNYLKRHHVVSEENKTDIKQNNNEKVHQISCSGVNENSKGGEYLIFCQDSAQKCKQDEILHGLNWSADSGN